MEKKSESLLFRGDVAQIFKILIMKFMLLEIVISYQFIHILFISCIDVHVDMDTSLFPARPDPEDTSVLTLQHRHRSSTIHVDPDMGHVLTCRHKFHREWVLDDHVRPYIIQSGFMSFIEWAMLRLISL